MLIILLMKNSFIYLKLFVSTHSLLVKQNIRHSLSIFFYCNPESIYINYNITMDLRKYEHET